MCVYSGRLIGSAHVVQTSRQLDSESRSSSLGMIMIEHHPQRLSIHLLSFVAHWDIRPITHGQAHWFVSTMAARSDPKQSEIEFGLRAESSKIERR